MGDVDCDEVRSDLQTHGDVCFVVWALSIGGGIVHRKMWSDRNNHSRLQTVYTWLGAFKVVVGILLMWTIPGPRGCPITMGQYYFYAFVVMYARPATPVANLTLPPGSPPRFANC
jgi:hypothetical protein